MEFSLNNTNIEQPTGIIGLYLTEVRSDRYFGIVRRKTARVKGIGQVQFIEPKAVNLISKLFQQQKLDANINFQVKDNYGNEFYSGYLDFATQTRTEQGINISFRDDEPINQFDSNVDTIYSIEPNTQITLKKQNIFGVLSHEIDTNLASVFSTQEFAIPFKAKNKESVGEGLAMSVTNVFGTSPVYINNTTQPKNINVTGQLIFQASSATANTFNVALEVLSDAGSVIKDLHMVSFSANGTLANKNVIFRQAITLQPNESISIMIHSVNGECSMNFDSASFLSIEEDVFENESQCYAISVYDIFQSLVNSSNGELTFDSNIAKLKKLYITNGYNIRGIKSNINASFGKIFDDLKKIFCLSCNSDLNKIIMSYIKDLPNGYIQHLDRSYIVDLNYTFASEYVHNTVKAGYNTWQSGTQLGNEETNTNAEYASKYKNIKSSLDLVCSNLITASKLIEYVRRMQYKQDKSNSATDDKFDESLFLIDTESEANETLSPLEILKNWQFFLGYSSEYNHLSSTGGYKSLEGYEQVKFASGGITGEIVNIQLNENFATYNQIYNVFSYNEGTQIKKALLLRKEYRLTQNTFLTGLVLE